jgi:hypothetical protein
VVDLAIGLAPVVVGVVVYLAGAAVLRIPEAGELLAALRRRGARASA